MCPVYFWLLFESVLNFFIFFALKTLTLIYQCFKFEFEMETHEIIGFSHKIMKFKLLSQFGKLFKMHSIKFCQILDLNELLDLN